MTCIPDNLPKANCASSLFAGQAAQAIKKGAATWLMVVQSDDDKASVSPSGVTAAAAGASQTFDSSGLLPDEEVQKIQQEFHDVFTPQFGCPPYQFDLSHT